jgi:magnesium transporter
VPPEGPSWFPLPRRDAGVREDRAPSQARHTGIDDVGAAVVDCGVYDEGLRQGGRVELETALNRADSCRDGFVWIGLHDPSAEVVEAVAEHFKLHPLAVEDAVHAHQRPKLEVLGDTLFLVLKTARHVASADEPVEIGEVMVFLGPRFVVTVRHGEGSPLHDVRLDLEAHPNLLGIGPSSVVYAVADRIVDDYAEVIEAIDLEVDKVEEAVFSGAGANPTERIYKLKREVLEFKRAVAPLVGPMQRLATEQAGLPLDPRTADYFRDVNDHLIRDAERIAAFDELLTGVLQANFAQLTVQDNQDLRKISSWVAIAAVPTMIFGLYGMNFEHMPELGWQYGYPAVLLVVLAICVALHRTFKRHGWL